MIRVSDVAFLGNEAAYLNDAIVERQLSSGPFVARFEEAFANYVGTRYAIAVSSGTAALHVALLAMGVEPGDEVIVPATTYISSAYAVDYCGATPVFVDVDPKTWTIGHMRPTLRTAVIMPVHLYGVLASPNLYGADVPVLEDAAEAHGARSWRGYMAGSIGLVGAFSFFGNKILACGEGGMVTTSDEAIARKVRQLRSMGHSTTHRYVHNKRGFSYRMTELSAAVGLAQLESIDTHLAIRTELLARYQMRLHDVETQRRAPGSAPWVYPVLVDNRDKVADELRVCPAGIETRPVFPSLTKQPVYIGLGHHCPVAEDLGRRGLLLPLHSNMTYHDVDTVCDALLRIIK